MLASLPGMFFDENSTVSPAFNFTAGWLPAAIRASAALPAPWLPVTR